MGEVWCTNDCHCEYGQKFQIGIPDFPIVVNPNFKIQKNVGELIVDGESSNLNFSAEIKSIENVDYFFYNFEASEVPGILDFEVQFNMRILNHKNPEDRLPDDRDLSIWHKIKLSDILETDSGYLKDGSLLIELKIYVFAWTGEDQIRRFNFNSRVPDEVSAGRCIGFRGLGNQQFYIPQELVVFHDKKLAEKLTETNMKPQITEFFSDETYPLLQLFHGVRWNYKDKHLLMLTCLAYECDVPHVSKICDKLLAPLLDEYLDAQRPHKLKDIFVVISGYLPRHCLKIYLRRIKSARELNELIFEEQIDLWKLEAKKKVAAKFFSFA